MRVGIVRTDLGEGVYVADLRSRTQYNPVLEPAGQSRNMRRPTDTEVEAVLAATALPLVLLGTETSATVDTGSNDTLRIRVNGQSAYTVIAVTSGVSTAKTLISDELNTAFASAGLPFVSAVVGTNQIEITTTGTNVGANAGLDIDTIANGSTLNTAVTFADGATLVGTSDSANRVLLQAAVYPTSVTIDVSEATIIAALDNAANLSAGDQTTLATAIADVIAPQLIETGNVLMSLSQGVLGELVDPTFQPGGVRAGLPAGEAAHIVENDGSTTFTA